MRGLEGGSEGVFIGAGAVVLIGVAFVLGGGCQGGGAAAPMDDYEQRCEQAWVDERTGEADDEDAALLAQAECQAHNANARQVAELEDRAELQEAQTP